jgi:hypothetical protein
MILMIKMIKIKVFLIKIYKINHNTEELHQRTEVDLKISKIK